MSNFKTQRLVKSKRSQLKPAFLVSAIALVIAGTAYGQTANTDDFSNCSESGKGCGQVISGGSTSSPITVSGEHSGYKAGVYIHDISGAGAAKDTGNIQINFESGSKSLGTELSSDNENWKEDWQNGDNYAHYTNTGALVTQVSGVDINVKTGATISGYNGLVVKGHTIYSGGSETSTGSKVGTLTIDGTIEAKGYTRDKEGYQQNGSALILSGLNSSNASLTTVEKLDITTGKLTSSQGAGVYLDSGVNVKEISVGQGASVSGYYGIYSGPVRKTSNTSGWAGTTIGKISSSGSISGKYAAIFLANGNSTSNKSLDSTFAGIEVTSGSVAGGTYGIYLSGMKGATTSEADKTATVEGANEQPSIQVTGGKVTGGTGIYLESTTLKDIVVSGTSAQITGSSIGINVNSGSSVENIKIEGSGAVLSGGTTGLLVNTGATVNAITVSGSGAKVEGGIYIASGANVTTITVNGAATVPSVTGLDASNTNASITSQKGSAITIAGSGSGVGLSVTSATVSGAQSGIYSERLVSGTFTLSGSSVTAGSGYGVYLKSGAGEIAFSGSNITTTGEGGFVVTGDVSGAANFSGGSISGGSYGLYLGGVNTLTVSGTSINATSGTGLLLNTSSGAVSITNATISGASGAGIEVLKTLSSGFNLSSGSVSGSKLGVSISGAQSVSVSGTTISSADGNGFQSTADISSGFSITSGSITAGGTGVLLQNVGGLTLAGTASVQKENTNTLAITASGAGVLVGSIGTSGANISSTTISAGTGPGLYVEKGVSGSVSISGSSIKSSGGYGVYLGSGVTSGVTLNNTTIESTDSHGLVLQGSIGKTTVKEGGDVAIQVSGTTAIKGAATGGIGLFLTGSGSIVSGGISVANGATISGGSTGIYIGEGVSVNGKIDVSGTVSGIVNYGTVSGGIIAAGDNGTTGVLENYGTVSSDVTLVGKDGTGTGFYNGEKAVVSGNVSVSGVLAAAGNRQAEVANYGTISGSLTVSGTGTINVVNGSGASVGAVKLNDTTSGLEKSTGNHFVFTNGGNVASLTIGNGSTAVVNQIGSNSVISGAVSYAASADTNGAVFHNEGTISGALTITGSIKDLNASSKDLTANFYNAGTVSGKATISTSGNGVFANVTGAKLGEGLTYNGSGSLVLLNSGSITGDVTLGTTTVASVEGKTNQSAASLLTNSTGATISGAVSITNTASQSGSVFSNAGTVNGDVTVNASGSTSATTFVNNGTISGAVSLTSTGKADQATFYNGGQGTITGNVTVTGTLSSAANGVTLQNDGTIKGSLTVNSTDTHTLVNSGRLESGVSVQSEGSLNLVNATGSFIGKDVTLKVAGTSGHAGFANDGTISGAVTLTGTLGDALIFGSNSTVTGLVTLNTSDAQKVSNGGKLDKGLKTGNDAKIDFENKSGASVSSDLTYTTTDNSKNPFTNAGTIQGAITIAGSVDTNGLFLNRGSITGNTTISTSGDGLYRNSGTISGSISYTGTGSLTYEGLEGSTLTGDLTVKGQGTKSAFSNAGKITGNVTIEGGVVPNVPEAYALGVRALPTTLSDATNTYTNTGSIGGTFTIKGTDATVSNTGSIGGALTVDGNKATITNTGAISGAIIYQGSGSATIDVSATGSVGKTNNANLQITDSKGSVSIVNWPVSVTANDEGKNVVTPIATSGEGKVAEIQTLTITSIEGTKPGQGYNFSTVLTGSAGTSQTTKPQNVALSPELSNAAIGGTYDPEKGEFTPVFNADRSSAGLVTRTYISHMMRRDFFLDSLMTEEAARGVNEGQVTLETKNQVFVKPYASHSTFDLSGVEGSGNTFGILVGDNIFMDKTVLTVLAGFEHSSTDSDLIDTKTNTGYVAANGVRLLTTSPKYDTFAKVVLKAGYTTMDIDRTLSADSGVSTADTKGVSFGASAHVGVNYKVSDFSQIVPSAGLGYYTGQLDDFTMANSTLEDTYEPGRVNLGYATVSLSWNQHWSDRIHSMLSGGVRLNFNRTQSTVARINNVQMSGDYELPGSWEYLNASVSMRLTNEQEISVGYNGVFDNTGATHSAVAKWCWSF